MPAAIFLVMMPFTPDEEFGSHPIRNAGSVKSGAHSALD
jgi:hypothetical protein